MIDLVFVGDRCNDHSQSSGYDQVCSLFPTAGWLSGRALERGDVEWHRQPFQSSLDSCRTFHVIYGDCSGKALPEILRTEFPQALVVSTVHRPVARLKEDPIACKALDMSDAIVTVSEVQANELGQSGLQQPIYPIPHGIWTEVFRPRGAGEQRQDVLIVGSFLRDWDGAKQVAKTLAQAGVSPIALGASARENLSREAYVKVSPRLSEAELAELYRGSAAVFLPYLDATASNALLEAMSAGCPIVCPRMPSLTDEYLADDSDAFEPGRYDVAAARLLHYARNPSDRQTKGQELIERATTFDWSRIKQQYVTVFRRTFRERASTLRLTAVL